MLFTPWLGSLFTKPKGRWLRSLRPLNGEWSVALYRQAELLEDRTLLSAVTGGALDDPALTSPEFETSQIIVDFQNTTEPAFVIDQLLPGATLLESLGLGSSTHLVGLPEGVTVELATSVFSTSDFINFAEPDYFVSTLATPNDPRYLNGSLWGLNNTGQNGGTPDADIDAPEAWDLATGSRDILIGDIDTGFDYTHPDLYLNVWLNPGEIPASKAGLADTDGDGLISFVDLNDAANSAFVTDVNLNGYIDGGDLLNDMTWEDGVDTDSNGFTDDLVGWDFANNDNDPFDGHGHGTHVFGTFGGVGNNGVGVAGVNWEVTVAGIKFLADSGGGTTSNAILSVNYATSIGVNLTNNSWGGGGFSSGLFNAISAANDAGQLFIAAAGNSNSDNDVSPNYPSSYDVPNVIAVAATTRTDEKSNFSSYGATSVDLGAPGSAIVSTLPNNSYASWSGTSMATPHVTGAAALVWSTNPGAGHLEIRDAIFNSVDVIASMVGIVATDGRLNAFDAIRWMSRGVSVTPSSGLVTTEAGGQAMFDVVLDVVPTSDVIVTLSSSDETEGTIDGAFGNQLMLTFTSTNWNVPQTVTITGADDTVVDGDIAYTIVTSQVNTTDKIYSGLDPADVAVVNEDNDQASFSIDDVTLVEGDSPSTTNFVFTVTLTGDVANSVTLDFATADGSATLANNDYLSNSGTLNFSGTNGETRTVTVTVNGDGNVEGDETFFVDLSNIQAGGLNVIFADNQGLGTILNDDITSGELQGTLWNDPDGNGVQDPGEVVLAGWTVFLDTNRNEILDAGEVSTTTDASGDYIFQNLAPGIYSVAEVIPAGWEQTFPGQNPANPIKLIANNNPDGLLHGDVWADGNYAYMGHFSTTGGVDIFDISNPLNPTFLTNWQGSFGGNQIKDVKVHNGIGYFASDNGGGLYVVDVSNPAAPVELARVTSLDLGFDSIHNVYFDNGYLYEADSRVPEIRVFDMSNPASPLFVRVIVATGFVHDITVQNGILYASNFGSGETQLFDVSDVANSAPSLGTFASGSRTHANAVTQNGNYIVVAREISAGDVNIWDIGVDGTPSSPVLVASMTAASLGIDAYSPHNPMIDGNLLYVSWYQAGVQAFDISDPTNPIHLGGYDTFPGAVSGFDGNWGVYPLPSNPNLFVASDIRTGLYLLSTPARNSHVIVLQKGDVLVDLDFGNRNPGITLTPTDPLQTEESGTTASFDIVLDTKPSAPVTIDLSSSDETEAILQGAVANILTLTFDDTNWNVVQTVTVQGVDDFVDDNNQPFIIVTNPSVSTDSTYDGIDLIDLDGVNLDDDTAGVIVDPLVDLVTTEAGGTAEFTVVLASEPLQPVEIVFASDDLTEGNLQGAINDEIRLIFDATNWDQVVTITVIGQDDSELDGDIPYNVVTPTIISLDPKYDGLDPDDVSLINLDDDVVRATFFSVENSIVLQGIPFADEDIIQYFDNFFDVVVDGSDVGLANTSIDGFHIQGAGSILMSLGSSIVTGFFFPLPGLPPGTFIDDSDILKFLPTSLGNTTTGTFELFFDASAADLTTSNENVDAVTLLGDGRLVVSTSGDFSVPGVSGGGEDLIAFTPTSAGNYLSGGTWEMYFDGSTERLTTSGELVDAASVEENSLFLSTEGAFDVLDVSGQNEDVFVYRIPSGTYSDALYFDGSELGLSSNNLTGLDLLDGPLVEPGSGCRAGERDLFKCDGDGGGFGGFGGSGDDSDGASAPGSGGGGDGSGSTDSPSDPVGFLIRDDSPTDLDDTFSSTSSSLSTSRRDVSTAEPNTSFVDTTFSTLTSTSATDSRNLGVSAISQPVDEISGSLDELFASNVDEIFDAI